MEVYMKKIIYTILLLTSFSLVSNSQMTQIKNFLEKPEIKLIGGEFLKSKWQIEGGIGFNIQIVPSRLNSAEYTSSNSTRKERIENSMGIAPGLALALNIQPIKNKYLAYQYQVKFSEAWLFPMSASTYWEAHHLALGYEFLFFTMNFEYSNLTYSYSDQTISSSSLSNDDILEEKSSSIYESNSNSYGVQWLMNNEKGRSLEFRKINKNITNNDASGYGIYFRNKNNMLQFEYFANHPINATTYVKDNILKEANLINTSSYFHFSYIKYFGFGSDYPNTKRKLLY
jgi:hypothetical protein